jgi:hypothetical protein
MYANDLAGAAIESRSYEERVLMMAAGGVGGSVRIICLRRGFTYREEF